MLYKCTSSFFIYTLSLRDVITTRFMLEEYQYKVWLHIIEKRLSLLARNVAQKRLFSQFRLLLSSCYMKWTSPFFIHTLSLGDVIIIRFMMDMYSLLIG